MHFLPHKQDKRVTHHVGFFLSWYLSGHLTLLCNVAVPLLRLLSQMSDYKEQVLV